jgi:hypothetical protein
VLRLDFAPINGAQLTTTGALRIPAALGRVGVLTYRPPGGPVRRELRPPDEVFRADSMDTLAGAVVTDQHPPREEAWIDPASWKKWTVGFVGDSLRQDGNLLTGVVQVQDAAMIALIKSGQRREISPGYVCRMDATPGRWDGNEYGPHVDSGDAYDFIQRDIMYNNVGIGPRGWGRQGSEVALRLDSIESDTAIMRADASDLGDYIRLRMLEQGKTIIDLANETGIIVPRPNEDPLLRIGPAWMGTYVLENILDGFTNRPSDEQLRALADALDVDLDTLIRLLPAELQKLDSHYTDRTNITMPTLPTDHVELHLDGLDATVPKVAAQVITNAIKTRDVKIAELTKGNSELQARFDGLTEKFAKAEADAKELPAKLRAEVAARAALEGTVRKVLGAEVRLDGKTDKELRLEVLAKLAPKLDPAGKDDAYLLARFDTAIEDLGTGPTGASSQIGTALFGNGGPAPQQRQDSKDEPDPVAAREAMRERNANAWKSPAPKA